jgi:hypothetical protein
MELLMGIAKVRQTTKSLPGCHYKVYIKPSEAIYTTTMRIAHGDKRSNAKF